jgi:transposase-like protein
LSPGLSVAEFTRRRNIRPNLLRSWRRQIKTGELPAPAGEAPRLPSHLARVKVAH